MTAELTADRSAAAQRDGAGRSSMRVAMITCIACIAALATSPAARAQAPSQPSLPQPPLSSSQPTQAPSPQSNPSPEEMQRRAVSAAATMLPLISKMAEDSAEAQLRIAERPETAERIATFKKNLYDALRRKGFTADQALELTSTTSVQSFTPNR